MLKMQFLLPTGLTSYINFLSIFYCTESISKKKKKLFMFVLKYPNNNNRWTNMGFVILNGAARIKMVGRGVLFDETM